MSDRTVRDTAEEGGALSLSPYLFVILEGERPLDGGSRHKLSATDVIELGRAPERTARRVGRTLSLGFPDRKMSARHARIVRDGASFRFEDAGSTNGSRLDGESATSAILVDGTFIDVGSVLLRFRASLVDDGATAADIRGRDLDGLARGLGSLVPGCAASLAPLPTVARSVLPALLLGESGTGKEVIARALHEVSGRAGPFVSVNCGALPPTLVESQLFGHVRGAFSGATRDEPGFVRASHGGTLFLDEIGDMPSTSQVALLRVLQEREVVPVGGTRPIAVDLRVIAATHRPVDDLEASGFRRDLFARLSGFTHRLWPLRERIEDLGPLVSELLPRIAGHRAHQMSLDPRFARALAFHDWPLNVRELEQALSVTALLARDGVLRLEQAPESLRRVSAPRASTIVTPRASAASAGPVSDEDRAIHDELVRLLATHEGNVTHVATAMGRTRMQIHRWLRRWKIDVAPFRGSRGDSNVNGRRSP